jgi:hypothetical protein
MNLSTEHLADPSYDEHDCNWLDNENEKSGMQISSDLVLSVPGSLIKNDLKELLVVCDVLQTATNNNGFSDSGMALMNAFITRTKDREAEKERRKEEIKDVPILLCTDVTSEFSREFIEQNQAMINTLFVKPFNWEKFVLINDLS